MSNSTKPQLEDGYFRVANELGEAMARTYMSSYESQIIWALLRKTYGFRGKKEDWIANSQFVAITKMHKAHVSRTIKKLLQRKIVTQNGNKIGLQKNYNLWLELPKQVTVEKLPKQVSRVTHLGISKLPKQADTKDIITKETYTKENTTNVVVKPVYGNLEINEAIDYMKTKLGLPILDESVQVNRNYANLLIKKFGGIEKLKLLIDATAINDFWSTRVTSMKTLYYKGVAILSSGRDNKFLSLQL